MSLISIELFESLPICRVFRDSESNSVQVGAAMYSRVPVMKSILSTADNRKTYFLVSVVVMNVISFLKRLDLFFQLYINKSMIVIFHVKTFR